MAVNPIDTYLGDVPAKQRAVLETLRGRIRAIIPEANEVISYRLHRCVATDAAVWTIQIVVPQERAAATLAPPPGVGPAGMPTTVT